MTRDNVTDIVERLRAYPAGEGDTLAVGYVCIMMEEAADTIATLRKQLENARSEALEEAAVCVEANKAAGCVINLNATFADIINRGFDDLAKRIRALKGQQ